jgi:hypothetical protein
MLYWLIGLRFKSLEHREFDWVFTFGDGIAIVAGCLWRLVDNDRIRLASEDHAHIFGLKESIDGPPFVNSKLTDATVSAIELREGTLDFRIHFNSGFIIELLPDSSGYEAWQVLRKDQQFIAMGGGELVIYGS